MKKIVIVGGGFAGVAVIRDLRNVPDIEIILVSDEPEFRYSPALYRTATGRLRKESSIPLEQLISTAPSAKFVHGKAIKIDRQKKQITLEDNSKISYDYCVIALGVVTSYFGMAGLDTFSYSIKTAHEVERLKRHLHEQLTSDNETDKNYVIVGAGPTGIELASALGQYIKRIARFHRVRRNKATIEVIEAADRVLPSMSPNASKIADKYLRNMGVKVMIKSKVKSESVGNLLLEDRVIPTHTVIWTAGVTNNPFFKENSTQFELDGHGKVVVDDYLSVDNSVFVIGDNASVKYAGLAQTAVTHAKYVSHGLKSLLNNEQFQPFYPRLPIYAVPLGTRNAIVEWYGKAFGGLIPAIIRSFADIIGYADVMGYKAALKLWLQKDEYEETCPVCRAPRITPLN